LITGVLINYDLEVLNLVWLSGLRSWKKRFLGFIVSDSIQFNFIQFC